MVLLTITPRILSAISLLPPDCPLHTAPSPTALPTSLSEPISHKTLIALSRTLQSTVPPSSQSNYTLNTLLHNTTPYHPPAPPPPQPSASYLALKARLLRDREQREYNALLTSKSNPTTTSLLLSDHQPENGTPTDDDPLTPTLVLNILLSILLCAFSVFWATRHWPNDGVRVLLSLGTGIVVGVAETVIYAAYVRKVAVARGREERRRERKWVVDREVVGGGNGQGRAEEQGRMDTGEKGEREEVWGRGVNGGVRRRVREKWEKGQRAEGRNEEELKQSDK